MADVSSHMRREQVTLPSHVVDLAADELRSTTGEQVELRPRSLAVLRLLAENAGRLVHKNEIVAEVWGDVVVTDDSLTQCIADIRKAIGDQEHRILRSARFRRGVAADRLPGPDGRWRKCRLREGVACRHSAR